MDEQPTSDASEPSVGVERACECLRVEPRPLGDHLLLVVSGEADSDTAETLRESLGRALAPTTRSVAIDVSRLRFCDLAGLDALEDFCADAATRQLPTVIHGSSPLLTWLRDVFVPLHRHTCEVVAPDT